MNLTITTFQSRRKPIGSTLELTWEEFKDKLSEATITSESVSEYFEMTNEQAFLPPMAKPVLSLSAAIIFSLSALACLSRSRV